MRLTQEEKKKYIKLLAPDLILLRTKANVSQDDLATIIGTSRQNYGAIERRSREMTWNTYLALVFFYNSYVVTKKFFKKLDSYPKGLFDKLNFEADEEKLDSHLSCNAELNRMLDNQALSTIHSIYIAEIIRCKGLGFEEAKKIVDSIIVQE